MSEHGGLPISRRTNIVITAVVSAILLASAGVALAEHEESHDEDTVFSFGYDEANHVFALNWGPNDTVYICSYGDDLTATYGEATEEGVIPVDGLADSTGDVEFDPRAQEELAAGLEEAEIAVPYTGSDGECGVNGVIVAGPNGQINHGQFMKAFRSLLDMKGHGCINRHIAQSDLGKTSATKLRVGDVDPAFEVGENGTLDLTTLEADCRRGKKVKDDGEAKAKGKPESPGKSGSAPGKNK